MSVLTWISITFVSKGAEVFAHPSDFIGENGCYSYKAKTIRKRYRIS